MLGPINYQASNNNFQQVRTIRKHFNPKFRKERGKKFIKVELPKFDDSEEAQAEEVRSTLKKFGILPQRSWQERPILISSTPQIFESYVVPEGDGKFSALSKTVRIISKANATFYKEN